MSVDTADPHAHVDERIGLLGDPHADFRWTKEAIEALLVAGVKQIHVLGDFSFVWHGGKDQGTLNRLSRVLATGDAHMYVTGGNHEGYAALYRLYPADIHGYRVLADRITWLPRGWRGRTEAGTILASLGGANSIDRWERKPAVNGHSGTWWPQERITEGDLAVLGTEPVDVLLGHDAPRTKRLLSQLASGRRVHSPKGRPYAFSGQKMFQRGVEQVQPKLVLSGHYHRFLDTTETFRSSTGESFRTRSIILNRNRKTKSIADLTLDTQELTFPTAPPASGLAFDPLVVDSRKDNHDESFGTSRPDQPG